MPTRWAKAEPSASGRRLPMTETDLESDHAGGDGRFQLPYTRLSPLNSTQPAVISTQPAIIFTQPAQATKEEISQSWVFPCYPRRSSVPGRGLQGPALTRAN